MKYKKSQPQPPKVIRASSASIDISGSLTGSLSDEDPCHQSRSAIMAAAAVAAMA